MLYSYQWFFVAAILAAILGIIAIESPKKRRVKVFSLLVTALFLPIAYTAANDLLSRPKPLQFDTALQNLKDATVVSSLVQEQEAIYLWLRLKGVEEPRAYKLPWNEQAAVALHKAQQQAEENGTDVAVQKGSTSKTGSGENLFYATAPEPLPLKAEAKSSTVVLHSTNTRE